MLLESLVDDFRIVTDKLEVKSVELCPKTFKNFFFGGRSKFYTGRLSEPLKSHNLIIIVRLKEALTH